MNKTNLIIGLAVKIVSKEIRLPKCVREGKVKKNMET